MPLSELKDRPKVIGTKQVRKVLARGQAKKVYIARDAEPHIVSPIRELCHQHNIEVENVDSMESLGEACGIDVGSATVALLND
ncbi:ribosomal L7Ae/L30e/S12e/Gadd45 family protein [Syntrophomonas erecta]